MPAGAEGFVDALGPAGSFRSRVPEPILGLHGETLGRLSLVPSVYVERALTAARAASDLSPAERAAALERAGELFRTGTPDGLAVSEYQDRVVAASGLPRTIVEASTRRIADFCASAFARAERARPSAAVDAPGSAADAAGVGVWTRRGSTFAVLAAGNHPAVHANWIEALALGYRVIVRPSRREPFTPYRLMSALREAGFPNDHVILLPTGHELTDTIVRGADRAMVYGGDDVVRRYQDSPRVLPQGPGRAKIVIPAGTGAAEHVDLVADSVARNAGVSCTSTTAVLVEGDARGFAELLAARLAELPSRDPESPDAVLPVVPLATARALADHLGSIAGGAEPLLGADQVVDDRGDGTAVLRPAVHFVEKPTDPLLRSELPFPCVWVAPWSPADGTDVFEDTLVLTIVDANAVELGARLLELPTVRNVYLGPFPTSWSAPGLPHDGYLADFLMETKTFVRSDQPPAAAPVSA